MNVNIFSTNSFMIVHRICFPIGYKDGYQRRSAFNSKLVFDLRRMILYNQNYDDIVIAHYDDNNVIGKHFHLRDAERILKLNEL